MIREYKVENIRPSDKNVVELEQKFLERFSQVLPHMQRDKRIEIAIGFLLEETSLEKNRIYQLAEFIAGYGIIDPLLRDDMIEEVLISGPDLPILIYHRRFGKCVTNLRFESEEEISRLIRKIKIFCGVKIDKPIINTFMPDGSRINLTLPPVSFSKMIVITIRKYLEKQPSIVDLINNGTMSAKMAAFLWMCVDGFGLAPRNIIITGGTSSGKTTLLNALLTFSREYERIVSIEDILDLNLSYCEDWVRTRTTDEIDMSRLVENSLRLRPDRIVVGEVRGPEAYNLVAAMNVGHNAMGTIHANSARDMITRMTSPPMNVPLNMLSVIDLVIVLTRFYEGEIKRRVTYIEEVGKIHKGMVQLGPVFEYDGRSKKTRFTKFPSITIGRIAEISGLTEKDVIDEIKKREIILRFMVKKGISKQDDFVDFIREYYNNPDKILGLVRKG